jgi:hypothetical protein
MDALLYLAQRQRECGKSSVSSEALEIAEEAGGEVPRWRLLGRVDLRDDAFVQVHEVIQLDPVHRIKYAYYLFVDGREIGGYERDPVHEPAEHRHCTHRDGHISGGEPAETVSFKRAIELAWVWLSAH